MSTSTLRNRLRRLERASAEAEGKGPCPACNGRGVLEVFIGDDDPRPHPGCLECGRVMKVVLVGANEPNEPRQTP